VELRLADGTVVAEGFPDARGQQPGHRLPGVPPEAETVSQLIFSAVPLPREFALTAEAVMDSGVRLEIGTVRGRRRALRSHYAPRLQPLSLTSVGRTGTNWLLALLSRHPQLAGVPPFEASESMLVNYWIGVLHALAQPASYLQTFAPYQTRRRQWWLGPAPLPLQVGQPALAQWLGRDNIGVVAGFCQSQFDAFYTELATSEQHPDARYFVHKSEPGPVSRTMSELYPAGRELVLVRDFRDWICSRIDYSAQHQAFADSSAFATEAEWLLAQRHLADTLASAWRERRDHVHLVRYEDLIAEPTPTLAALLSYVGVDHDDDTINLMLTEARQLNPDQQVVHRTSPSVEASVGRWKQDMSPELQQQCAGLFDDLLVEFGYEPTAAA
jgi:hypothetical protein